MLTDDGKEKKTGKGIKKSVLKEEVRHQDYKDCLMEKREYEHSMMNFHSKQHQLHTIKQSKKSLSPFDDKRYILEDGFTTRAHGHYQNEITRPSKAAESSKKELLNLMGTLSLSSTNDTSLSNTDINMMETHDGKSENQSNMDLPLPPPPTNDKFHAYLASFWK